MADDLRDANFRLSSRASELADAYLPIAKRLSRFATRDDHDSRELASALAHHVDCRDFNGSLSMISEFTRSPDTANASSCAISLLIELLKDPQSDVRISALKALSHFDRAEVVPRLIELLEDPESDVRICAASALGQLGRSEAAASLIELSKGSGRGVRIQAAEALGQFSSASASFPLDRWSTRASS